MKGFIVRYRNIIAGCLLACVANVVWGQMTYPARQPVETLFTHYNWRHVYLIQVYSDSIEMVQLYDPNYRIVSCMISPSGDHVWIKYPKKCELEDAMYGVGRNTPVTKESLQSPEVLDIPSLGKVKVLDAQKLPRYVGGATISPDGNLIAYWGKGSAGRNIYILNLQTMLVKTMPGGWTHAFGLSWSPDGKHIAYLATLESGEKTAAPRVLELATGKDVELCGPSTTLLYRPSPFWSLDGTKVFFVGSYDTYEMLLYMSDVTLLVKKRPILVTTQMVLQMPKEERQRFSNPYFKSLNIELPPTEEDINLLEKGVTNVSRSPTGSHLRYESEKGKLFIRDMKTGKDYKVFDQWDGLAVWVKNNRK